MAMNNVTSVPVDAKADRTPGQHNPRGSWLLLASVVEGLLMLGEEELAAQLYPLTLELIDTGPVDCGLLMIDDLGKTKGFGPIKSAALRYDRAGRLAAKAGFAHGLHRLGVHPLGHGFVAMSADGVLHAYGEDLQPLFKTGLHHK
jgi:hypothetical protein